MSGRVGHTQHGIRACAPQLKLNHVGLTFVSISLFRSHEISFSLKSVADGHKFWLQKWGASEGVTIHEYLSGYSSEEEARIVFDEGNRKAIQELKDVGTIIEGKINRGGVPKAEDRFVGLFINPQTKEISVSITRLQKDEIYSIAAPSLEYALAFEKYREQEEMKSNAAANNSLNPTPR
jgi:hypothetical protein